MGILAPVAFDSFFLARMHLTDIPRLLARRVFRHGLADHKGKVLEFRKRGIPASGGANLPISLEPAPRA